MYYVLYCTDNKDSAKKRQSVRLAHLQRLQALHDAGRLMIAGPLPVNDLDYNVTGSVGGSLIIAKFENITQARLWADADPYVAAGVYKKITITPFVQSYPKHG